MRLRTTVYGLILCLLLAGCGFPRANVKSTVPNGREKAMLVPRGTRPVVKIGLVAPFEGRYRSLGYEVLHAVKLAVRERNAAGGVAGHMVELVALDDGDDPDASAVQAGKLAVDEQVMGVIGPFSEVAVRAAAPIYQAAGLAAVTPATCPSNFLTLSADGAVFCLGADEQTLLRALVDRLPANARVVLLRAATGTLGDSLLPATGRVLEAPWDDAALADLGENPADVLLYDGDVLDAADFLIQAREAGIDIPLWGGPSLARSQLAQIAGEAAEGTCHALTAPLLSDLSPDSAFVTGYRELSGALPGPWAVLAYDAANLLLDAIERAIEAEGIPTREGVVAALAQARGPDGEPVFDRGQRRGAEVLFYCYEPGDVYPGTRQQ